MTRSREERIAELKKHAEQDKKAFQHVLLHNGEPVKMPLQLAIEIIDELQSKLESAEADFSGIENCCDNQNDSHRDIWHIAFDARKKLNAE